MKIQIIDIDMDIMKKKDKKERKKIRNESKCGMVKRI